jgi:hypothetical protein
VRGRPGQEAEGGLGDEDYYSLIPKIERALAPGSREVKIIQVQFEDPEHSVPHPIDGATDLAAKFAYVSERSDELNAESSERHRGNTVLARQHGEDEAILNALDHGLMIPATASGSVGSTPRSPPRSLGAGNITSPTADQPGRSALRATRRGERNG